MKLSWTDLTVLLLLLLHPSIIIEEIEITYTEELIMKNRGLSPQAIRRGGKPEATFKLFIYILKSLKNNERYCSKYNNL
jgi:hypothetical protein